MITPVNPSVNKVDSTDIMLTFQSANPSSYPFAYVDNLWDVIFQNSALSEFTENIGQFDQHTINELLANRVRYALDKLSQGALFLGEAQLDTQPNNEVNGFYVALTEGTYINFLSSGSTAISVAVGEIALLVLSGSAWAKQHIITMPYIDSTTKHWIVDGKDSGVVAEGQDGANGVTPHIDSTTGNWFIGETNTGVHAQGVPGQDAVNPFKGWYDAVITGEAGSKVITSETENLPANPGVGDYAYVKTLEISGDAPSQTETPVVKIYECATAGTWTNSGREFNPAYSQSFQTGQEVNETPIDNTHLTNTAANSLPKADDAMQLNSKLLGITRKDTRLSVEVRDGYYISIERNGETYPNSGRSIGVVNVENVQKVRFLGIFFKNNTGTGYAFYDNAESNECMEIDGVKQFKKYEFGAASSQPLEYEVDVPEGAVELRWTIRYSANNDYRGQEYAYKIEGRTVMEEIENLNIEGIQHDLDEISDSLKKSLYDVDSDFDMQLNEEGDDELHGFVRRNGQINESDTSKYRIRIYHIDPTKKYAISTNYVIGSGSGFDVINYFSGDEHKGHELAWNESNHLDNFKLTVPSGTDTIKMNVKAGAGDFDLEEIIDEGYYDIKEMGESINELKDSSKKSLTVEVISEENIRLRGRYDDNNDIVITIGYAKNYKKVRNFLRPRYAYIGNKNFTTDKLLSNAIVQQNISDTIGPITMDWCGPVYANHGYSTPSLTFVDSVGTNPGIDNPFVSNPQEEIGSIWEDDLAPIESTVAIEQHQHRQYIIANITNSTVYLLPLIYQDNDGYPHRDFVYYNSPKDDIEIYELDENGNRVDDGHGGYVTKIVKGLKLTKVSDAEGKHGVAVGTPFTGKYKRFDYQVCECKNFMLSVDGLDVPIDKVGNYQGNEFKLCYQQICYDASEMKNKFISGWNGTAFTHDFAGVPVQAIFDRQLIFSGSLGFLSYTCASKMNVLIPFKMGENFTGNPNGRYLGWAPTAFLNPEEDPESQDKLYNSFTYIPKLKKQYAGSSTYSPIDFTKEFGSNYENTAPQITLNRDENDLEDVDNMPERLYSYLKNITTEEPQFGVAGGHSLVRGASMNSVRNSMIPYTTDPLHPVPFGWWNPPISNKFYSMIMKHGDGSPDNTIVTDDYIATNEGFFCWYKPQLTNAVLGATIHAFYYKSGDEYIVYIHTKGSHDKGENVILPTLLDGKTVLGVVEQKGNNIEVLDNIVVANRLHIRCTASTNDECNWIVIRVK